MSGTGSQEFQTPLGGAPATGQITVDQQRNQMLASLAKSLAALTLNNSVFAFTTVTTSTAITTSNTSVFADATSGAITITLPLAASAPGKEFLIEKIDSSGNAVTVSRAGSDTINGSTTKSLASQYNFTRVQSVGGTIWYIVG